MENSKEWKSNGKKQCEMFKMEVGERVAAKGVVTINYNIQKVYEFLLPVEVMPKINPDCVSAKTL